VRKLNYTTNLVKYSFQHTDDVAHFVKQVSIDLFMMSCMSCWLTCIAAACTARALCSGVSDSILVYLVWLGTRVANEYVYFGV
jgi:hypothetical protein